MILLDSNEKIQKLLDGNYAEEDILYYNANEAEIRPDYDYSKLQAKSYIEVTGCLDPPQNLKPNHQKIIYPWFWLVDTIRMVWDNDATDPKRYWQTTRPPAQLYTCMLGQLRPHREMIFDLLLWNKCVSQYLTFAGKGIYRDVVEPIRQDVGRVVWSGSNQQKTHRFPPWYDLCLIDLVVETHEDHTFYTEKTWKPFLGMRLPMIFGNCFMMQPLMEWGFRFPLNIVDYSYDNEPNPYLRARALVMELKRLREEVGMEKIHKETLTIRKQNQRLCFKLLDTIELPSEVPEFPAYLEHLEISKKLGKRFLSY